MVQGLGPWCKVLGHDARSWAMVQGLGPWCKVLGHDARSWAMVQGLGPWCKVLGHGARSWAMVQGLGPWCKVLGHDARSWAMMQGLRHVAQFLIKRMGDNIGEKSHSEEWILLVDPKYNQPLHCLRGSWTWHG